jgi:hypothetical protein
MRRNRTDNELEAAAKHVRYEIRMLVHSSRILGAVHGSPAVMDLQGDDRNMALESFLIHYRNLRAFLCPSLQPTGDDDILASDFLDAVIARNVVETTKLETDKKRLNKTLAHLTYSRNQYIEPADYQWETGAMSIDMLDELENFVGLLQPDRAQWFPRAAELASWKSEVRWGPRELKFGGE